METYSSGVDDEWLVRDLRRLQDNTLLLFGTVTPPDQQARVRVLHLAADLTMLDTLTFGSDEEVMVYNATQTHDGGLAAIGTATPDVDTPHGIYLVRFASPLAAPRSEIGLHASSFSLSAYPNPFNPITQLEYEVPSSGLVSLTIYDLTGRRVQTLIDQVMSTGQYRYSFDGSRLPSGVYFARLQGKGYSKTQKLMLLK
jgi:hypothetical protein